MARKLNLLSLRKIKRVKNAVIPLEISIAASWNGNFVSENNLDKK